MPTPIPSRQLWEDHMLTSALPIKNAYWHKDFWGNNLPLAYPRDGLHYNEWYYDQTEVMYRIAHYTGNTATWHLAMTYPRNWFHTFSDNQTPVGNVAGYELFPRGIYYHWLVNADTASQDLMTELATNCNWTKDSADHTGYTNYVYSREMAYVINTYLYQQLMFGNAKRSKYDEVIGYVKAHVTEWWTTYVGTWAPGPMQPFMVGLTMRTLIAHYDKYADAAVPGLIKTCLDGLWTHAWMAANDAFYENSTLNTTPAPDLSLLIAPAFAWYYRQIILHGAPGAPATYRDRGNSVWAGGVLGADLSTETNVGKRFNQNYTWSFDYVTWYDEAEASPYREPLLFVG